MYLLGHEGEVKKAFSEAFEEGNITKEDISEELNNQLNGKNSRHEEKAIKKILKLYS